MHRILLVGLLPVLLLAGSGCQSVVGPGQRRCLFDRVDDPRLTIDEQERKARARLALPEDPSVAPPTGFEPPSYRGRF